MFWPPFEFSNNSTFQTLSPRFFYEEWKRKVVRDRSDRHIQANPSPWQHKKVVYSPLETLNSKFELKSGEIVDLNFREIRITEISIFRCSSQQSCLRCEQRAQFHWLSSLFVRTPIAKWSRNWVRPLQKNRCAIDAVTDYWIQKINRFQ